MIPVILAAVGGALLVHHFHKAKTAKPKVAGVSPARHHVFRHIIGTEIRPDKLDKAAKLFGQEGLLDHANALHAKAEQVRAQAKGAGELVERARAGDQNAMGMIAACRDNAKQGNERARISCVLIEDYCRRNPPPAPKEPSPETVAAGCS